MSTREDIDRIEIELDKERRFGGVASSSTDRESTGIISDPIEFSPMMKFIAVWGAIILAFYLFPFITHGLWSGPMGFGLITVGMLTTTQGKFKRFAWLVMVPLLVFGTYICMKISGLR